MKELNFSMAEFLAHGQLGPVHIGATREQIESLLGTPKDTASERKGWTIWKYGNLQFFFERNVLKGVGIYPEGTNVVEFAKADDINLFLASPAQLAELCAAQGTKWLAVPDLTNEDALAFESGIGVVCIWDRQATKLEKINFFPAIAL